MIYEVKGIEFLTLEDAKTYQAVNGGIIHVKQL